MNTPDDLQLPVRCPRCGTITQRHVPGMFAEVIRQQGMPCDSCAKLGRAERENLADAEQRSDREALWRKLVPAAYRLLGAPEDGLTDAARLRASPGFSEAMQWSGMVNVVLAGPSGALKTRTAFRLLRRSHDEGRATAWWSAFGFQGEAEEAAGDARRRRFMAGLLKPDVVLFDDLLKAPWTFATWSAFFELVEQRFSAGKPVVVTLNDGPDEIVAALDATRSPIGKSIAVPLIRRLTEGALLVEMHPAPPPQPQLALVA